MQLIDPLTGLITPSTRGSLSRFHLYYLRHCMFAMNLKMPTPLNYISIAPFRQLR